MFLGTQVHYHRDYQMHHHLDYQFDNIHRALLTLLT